MVNNFGGFGELAYLDGSVHLEYILSAYTFIDFRMDVKIRLWSFRSIVRHMLLMLMLGLL